MWKIILSAVAPVFIIYMFKKKSTSEKETIPTFEEDEIIQKNQTYITINNLQHRVVYISHMMKGNVPTILFIHGLGGQISQWTSLIKHFSNTANVLAMEQTGHGKSEPSSDYSCYSTDRFVSDLNQLLTFYPNDNFVLVGHSYGCCLATLLALKENNPKIKTIILISPVFGIPKYQQYLKKLIRIVPDEIIKITRKKDKEGGIHSPSVNRFIHPTASDDLRYKQLCWNSQSTISSFKRTLYGMRFPTLEEYNSITIPVLLIGGKDDQVAPISNITKIKQVIPSKQLLSDPYIIPNSGHQTIIEKPQLVAAFIQEFVIKKVGLTDMDAKVQILKTADMDKWSLKNYDKWKKKVSVSDVMPPSKFRGMKVMRQTDNEHCPKVFSEKYPNVGMVIDLTKDTPPYDSADLESRGVIYRKIATVSKIPPPKKIVRTFIDIAKNFWNKNPDKEIAVHCHYGTNRTGFLIACYLIEIYKLPIQEAIDIFAKYRPNGIKHIHFVDELYLRYSEYEKDKN
ncbi:alpha/beta-hydrolase [Anaeromyces robustus]|uniref:Alpha/beta-hydrolase n=1 Tax=Anaeromyces robustus TaxID=1754192 RepID=A0A1Y1XLD6_9FUNG|nr:alpha/beta-hydrolase [Anaeromyces robustus]|eukprot:ORX86296.1 alpha/beta-hydrolase [Anaeromyces robustus]